MYLGNANRSNGGIPVPTMFGYRLGMMTHRPGFRRQPLTGWETLDSYDKSSRNSMTAAAARPVTTYTPPALFSEHVATVRVVGVSPPDSRNPYSSHVDRRPSSPTVPATMQAFPRSVVSTLQLMRPEPLASSTGRGWSHHPDESWYSPSSSDGGRRPSQVSNASAPPGGSRRPSTLSNVSYSHTPPHMLGPLPSEVESGQGWSPHRWKPIPWKEKEEEDEAKPS